MTAVTMSAIDAALFVYKRTLSPVLAFFGARCRHFPSCSAYAATALKRHGPVKGGMLTVSRLCRCHPLGSAGFDPPPDTLAEAGWKIWRYGDWAWTQRGAMSAAASTPAPSTTRTHASISDG